VEPVEQPAQEPLDAEAVAAVLAGAELALERVATGSFRFQFIFSSL
jgi:hypothetical protein